FEDIISHSPENEWGKIANYRILSFDLEAMNDKGRFPTADRNEVIQIASVCADQNHPQGFVKIILTLGQCDPIPGAEIFCFDDEKELLL
ncbi:MAG: hypothetical protein MHPSP_003090, partial [Paramarteilia canceri]